jgi:hypothetical protein
MGSAFPSPNESPSRTKWRAASDSVYFDLPRAEFPTEPHQVVVFEDRMNVLHRTETKEEFA